MRQACIRFHREHPEVWDLFVRFVKEKMELGYKNYSSKAVMERIRWETDSGGEDPAFKINDHYTAFYTRRFEKMYPDCADFLRKRIQTSENHPPTNRPEPNRYQV